jgi:hypothetical protein
MADIQQPSEAEGHAPSPTQPPPLPPPRALSASCAAREPLSPSAVERFRTCPYSYQLAYEHALTASGYNPALAIGRAFGDGAEAYLLAGNATPECQQLALAAACLELDRCRRAAEAKSDPERIGQIRKQASADAAKVGLMLAGWGIAHADDSMRAVSTEHELSAPLTLRRRTSRTFRLKGRCDAIVERGGKLYIYELKTTSDTVDEVEGYLRHGLQVWAYQAAAAWMWPDVEFAGAIVDIVKKPTAKIRKGRKTKADESLEEFRDRALENYRERKDHFFRRSVFPWCASEQHRARVAFWRAAEAIIASRKLGFLKAPGLRCKLATGWCRYRSICWHETPGWVDVVHGFEVKTTFDGAKEAPQEGEQG